MRWLILFGLSTGVCFGQIGTPQFIASDNGGSTTTTTTTMSSSLNVASGSAIYAVSSWKTAACGSVTTTISRTGGGTFTQIGSYHSDSSLAICSSQWILCNAAASTTDKYVATASTAVADLSISVLNVTGIKSSACTDSGATTTADTGVTAANTVTSPSFTTSGSTPNEILVADVGIYGNTRTPGTTASGWTIGTNSFTDGNWTSIAYKIVSAQQTGITTNGTASGAATFMHLDTAGLVGASQPAVVVVPRRH